MSIWGKSYYYGKERDDYEAGERDHDCYGAPEPELPAELVEDDAHA